MKIKSFVFLSGLLLSSSSAYCQVEYSAVVLSEPEKSTLVLLEAKMSGHTSSVCTASESIKFRGNLLEILGKSKHPAAASTCDEVGSSKSVLSWLFYYRELMNVDLSSDQALRDGLENLRAKADALPDVVSFDSVAFDAQPRISGTSEVIGNKLVESGVVDDANSILSLFHMLTADVEKNVMFEEE
jgi:hypothetical protein